jgi:hypothetical protein
MRTSRNRKWKGRQTFTVPALSGNYSEQVLAFGAPLETPGSTAVVDDGSFEDVMAYVESIVAGATVELWVRKVGSDSEGAASMDIGSDYFLYGSPTTGTATQVGRLHWGNLCGWPAGVIRVKSGGSGGTMAISATAL